MAFGTEILSSSPSSSPSSKAEILASFSAIITEILSALPASTPQVLSSRQASATEFLSPFPAPSNPISGQPTLPDLDKLLRMADLSHAIIFIGIIFSILCLLLAVLRMVVRFVRENLAWDDYLMFTGSVFFCFNNALAIVAALSGIGVENFEIDWEKPLQGSKWIIYWGFTYAISTIPLKASLCFSLFRISESVVTRSVAYGLTGLTVVAALSQILWVCFACRPLSYLWDEVTQHGTCIHIEITVISIYLFAAVCIAVDFGVAVCVWPLLWDLQMPWTRKATTWVICTLGVVASIATIVRIFYIPAYIDMGEWNPDFYYKLGGVVITSQVEIGLAIIGGCLPSTRQGFRLVNWCFWRKVNGRYRMIKPPKIAVTLPRSVYNRPLVSRSRAALPITIMAPDIITASAPTDTSLSSIPAVPAIPERFISAFTPIVPNAPTTSGHVRSLSKTLGLTTVITGGLSKEERKTRKRKQKQRKRNVCKECGRRNCDEHADVLDPLNPPLDGIVVTQTIETTVTYDTTSAYAYPSGVPGLVSRGSFSTSVEAGPSSTARPSSVGSLASRGPRYRPLEVRQEEGIPLKTLTNTGRLASVTDHEEDVPKIGGQDSV